MENIKTNDDFTHPERKIQLLNGIVLDCYPLGQPEATVDNDLKLDGTGTYLVVGTKKPTATPKSDKAKDEERLLFESNAFRFLHYRNRIMSDSRMFLCPVPIQSGLAYTGTSGFQRPTLGIYLEWWLNCEYAMICSPNEPKKLVYQIAGSPMSGSNSCGLVDENGKTTAEYVYPFVKLWTSFMDINCRYDEAKSLYQAYTLKQVVEILNDESLTKVDDLEMENFFLKSALRRQQRDMSDHIKWLENKADELKFRLFYAYYDDLKAIMATYAEKKEKKDNRQAEIDEECKELYRKLKSGEIDNKHYQKQLTPLKKEKEHNIYLLREYRRVALDELLPNMHFNISDMETFFNNPRLADLVKSAKGDH